jgi:phosphopantetheine adenylyltransferase
MTKKLKVQSKPFTGCFDDFGAEHQEIIEKATNRLNEMVAELQSGLEVPKANSSKEE